MVFRLFPVFQDYRQHRWIHLHKFLRDDLFSLHFWVIILQEVVHILNFDTYCSIANLYLFIALVTL